MRVHKTNSSSARFPSQPSPTTPKSQEPQKTAESKRSLGCPVLPLPWLPKIRISLAISCPMAPPKLEASGAQQPPRPEFGPKSSKPRLGEGQTRCSYQVWGTLSVTLQTWESHRTLAPSRCGGIK